MRKKLCIRIIGLSLVLISSSAFPQPVTLQWAKNYNGPLSINDLPSAMATDRFGNVYVTGVTNAFPCPAGCSFSTDFADQDYITIKYNSAGVQQWAVRYNGLANEQDQANAIAVDFFW